MTLDDLNSPNDLRQRAVHWFTRINSGDATHEEVAACAAWRRADPEHDRMYRSVEFFWQASRHLPENKLRAILAHDDSPRPAPRRLPRRAFGLGLASVCAIAVLAIAFPHVYSPQAEYQSIISTRPGERRDVTLPDGSVLNLNVGTQLEVAFYENQRVIELSTGEVFFSVKSDPSRAFLVKTSDAVVTVTGTRFNVRHDADNVQVSVESGSVNVSAGPWWRKTSRDLVARQALRVETHGQISNVATASIENVTAWREGKIVFDNAPLAHVVAEMNRYLLHPIQLDSPQLRDYRVAGVFSIDNPQAMTAALPAIAPVQLYHLPGGRIAVRAR